jgi:hypothetical protein
MWEGVVVNELRCRLSEQMRSLGALIARLSKGRNLSRCLGLGALQWWQL